MQRDGGLARAGPAVDHHDARLGLGDQLELMAVDQASDGLEVLVQVRRVARTGAQQGLAEIPRAKGCACPTLQCRRIQFHAMPAVPCALKHAQMAVHTHQPSAQDQHGPMGAHHALHDAPTQLFLVLVSLPIGEVHAADGRVAPVDDGVAHTRRQVGLVADKQVQLPPPLFHAQMAKVGRLGAMHRGIALLLLVGGDMGQLVHLGHDLRDLVLMRLGQGIAQVQQVLVILGDVALPRGDHRLLLHPLQDGQLLFDHLLLLGAQCRIEAGLWGGQHGVQGGHQWLMEFPPPLAAMDSRPEAWATGKMALPPARKKGHIVRCLPRDCKMDDRPARTDTPGQH